mmetsp:Transcript_18419/g.37775  ORF Transcript_18419/g.37775 Transcript_18419/m.37775 type:complete len:506 (-) Transcript_18419:1610-3127(-)
MSYDASSLRGYLQRIDATAPTIQGAAAAMMKHYDKSPLVAVNCWRDMLVQARSDQFLPLLYVANEVLQNSKRNRGNKFLEAFSPVLGQSLIYVCGKAPPSIVESIRRTVKIWAERRVFSIRYVNDLIKGLEPYRSKTIGGGRTRTSSTSRSSSSNSSSTAGHCEFLGSGRFSPDPDLPVDSQDDQSAGVSATNDFDSEMGLGNGDGNGSDQDEDNLFDDGNNNDDDDDDDDDDLFGNASNKLLKINIDFDVSSPANSNGESTNKKRRRTSENGKSLSLPHAGADANKHAYTTLGSSKSKPKRRNGSQHLSTSSLMELMNQVSALRSNHDRVSAKLEELQKAYDDSDSNSNNNQRIETLVGDELLEEYKKTIMDEQEIEKHKRQLHSIAQTQRGLELDALRYLPWLERALKQDTDDIDFSNSFRTQLKLFKGVYQPTKEARDKRLMEEALRIQKEEELQRKKREEEERKKFMESAMSKQTEAQPGMVWNRATGEYQHLNQEESWRD